MDAIYILNVFITRLRETFLSYFCKKPLKDGGVPVQFSDPLIIIIFLAGFYMAWNIGANDLANAMGTSVGSKALTIKQVIILASILEFCGAVFFGKRVTTTIAKGIVPIELLDQNLVTIGALSAILIAGIWITLATLYKLPVSTTHSIVGAVLGFGLGLVIRGSLPFSAIKWRTLLNIVASWVISPISGAISAFLIFYLIRRFILEHTENVRSVEKIFGYLQIASASYVAFAHGSNDVANAVGPVAAALGVVGSELPRWVLAIGGLGIVLGLATWGYRVIETVGEKITTLTPTRGFSAEFGTASTVLVCSSLGLPISTTHTLVGAVVGVGLAGGIEAVDLSVLRKIVYSWVVTVPFTALGTLLLYIILEAVI